jgi:hypothetical protein
MSVAAVQIGVSPKRMLDERQFGAVLDAPSKGAA